MTQPRLVHVPAQQIMGLMVGHFVSRAYAQYKPDLVVSVHPLMQVCCCSAAKHQISPVALLPVFHSAQRHQFSRHTHLSTAARPASSNQHCCLLLQQGVPLRVLKSRIRQGLQDPINFATVVTDLCTCHNT